MQGWKGKKFPLEHTQSGAVIAQFPLKLEGTALHFVHTSIQVLAMCFPVIIHHALKQL